MLMLSIVGVGMVVGVGSLTYARRAFFAGKREARRRGNVVDTVISGLLLFAVGLSPAAASSVQANAQLSSASDLSASQVSNAAKPSQPSAPGGLELQSASLPSPAMTGPLRMAVPAVFDAEPFGSLAVTGILSGFGYWQGDPDKSTRATSADLSNATIFVQRTKGLVQFFVQAGVYNFPALGSPVLSTTSTVRNYFGPIPVAYLKFSPNEEVSLLIGKLPTLMGMENIFTFQNFNVERGLLWNQTNNVTRGLQLNYTTAKLSSALSWNDGFYSNRYNWLTGSETYGINRTSTLALNAGGNLGSTAYSKTAVPLYQNNSAVFDLAYTYTTRQWSIEPYLQYTRVRLDQRIHVGKTTDTFAGAALANYTFRPQFSLAGRVEYIGNSGSPGGKAVNLLYGPGSRAWSLTLTPTYQSYAFFARGEFSFVQAFEADKRSAFGQHGSNSTQARFMIETGVMF